MSWAWRHSPVSPALGKQKQNLLSSGDMGITTGCCCEGDIRKAGGPQECLQHLIRAFRWADPSGSMSRASAIHPPADTAGGNCRDERQLDRDRLALQTKRASLLVAGWLAFETGSQVVQSRLELCQAGFALLIRPQFSKCCYSCMPSHTTASKSLFFPSKPLPVSPRLAQTDTVGEP